MSRAARRSRSIGTSLSSGNIEFLRSVSVSDGNDHNPLNKRLSNLEKRLDDYTSVYRLSVQAKNIREKKRSDQLDELSKCVEETTNKMNSFTDIANSLDEFVSRIVDEEVEQLKVRHSSQITEKTDLRVKEIEDLMAAKTKQTMDKLNDLIEKIQEAKESDECELLRKMEERIEILRNGQEKLIRQIKEKRKMRNSP